jgi:hypothetical protein
MGARLRCYLMITEQKMEKVSAEELIVEMVRMDREKHGPFPYAGCHFVLEGVEEDFECFIPDLDLWSLNIAGYCSGGAKILRWAQEELVEAHSRMSLGFFAKHPEYCRLQRFITQLDAPDLHSYLGAYEGLRRKLLEVFSRLLRSAV